MSIVVNGEYIDGLLIRREASILKQQLLQEMPDEDTLSIEVRARDLAEENVITTVLLRQAALASCSGTGAAARAMVAAGDPPERSKSVFAIPDKQLSQRAIDLRVEEFIAKLTAGVSQPSKREISDFYHKFRDRFYVPEMVRAAHIVRNVDERNDEQKARDAITKAKLELAKGRTFEQVADEWSDCPAGGGNLGWFTRGQMVDEFEAVVFDLDTGQISEVFRSAFGFHIAKLYERTPARFSSLNEVRQKIKETILNQRRQEALEHFVDRLRSRAEIQKLTARRASGRYET